MEREPAPALTRGLHLLRLLAAGRPATLEDLVRATAIPRSSLARMLQALAEAGVAARGEGLRWRALLRIEPLAGAPEGAVAAATRMLARLAADSGRRAEWWRFTPEGPELAAAREPRGWPVRVFAYPGWRPERRELMAPVVLWWAAAAEEEPGRCWYWQGARRRWLPAGRVRALADAARLAGAAACPAPNHNGLARRALVVRQRSGAALGALALVALGNEADDGTWPGLLSRAAAAIAGA
jgi:DNA-binding IclR family transcriptional regulator